MMHAAPRLTLTLPVLAALAAPLPASGQLPPQPFRVGTTFPTLSLPSLDGGRPASLADFRGRKLILHIFASW